MILNKQGESFAVEGRTFLIGGMVWANDESDYRGLFGRITEIRDGADKDTENEGPDIYCDFMVPEQEYMVNEIEKRFSALYRTPKHKNELPLGGVIMAPDMLEPVADTPGSSEGKLYALAFTYDGECDSTIGMVAVSADKSVLMRAMFDDLDTFLKKEGYKAVLSSTFREEGRERYTFEPAAVEESSFTLNYIIFEVPIYGGAKGGAVA